jgi:hypothetical protein
MGFNDGTRACTMVHYHMYQKEEDEGLSKNFICTKELIWIKMKKHSFSPLSKSCDEIDCMHKKEIGGR